MNDKLGEEIGEGRGVTVDTLDHFTGATNVVEAHVQVQTVEGEVVPHLVRCPPAYILAEVGAQDLYDLSREPDTEKQESGEDEVGYEAVGLRRVDEESKDLRVCEVQTDTRSHAEGKCQDSGLVRAEIPRQEGKIVPKGDARFADDAFVARGRLIRVDVGLQLVQKNEGLDGSSLSGSYR